EVSINPRQRGVPRPLPLHCTALTALRDRALDPPKAGSSCRAARYSWRGAGRRPRHYIGRKDSRGDSWVRSGGEWRRSARLAGSTGNKTKGTSLFLSPHLCFSLLGNFSASEEDSSTSSIENQAIPNSHRVPDSKSHPPHIKVDIIRKVQAKDTQRYKVEYDSQRTDTLNFSSESKQGTEYGPCRREMEDTLNHLKILNVLSPRGFHIPNCDKKGFYKKKQCRPSKGRKRGYCWCVDKYGQPLPGYDGKGNGDVHCYNLESK
uniref:Insulin like growth factor binding protein 3 n=1 Tax=Taeniopygia guttata TaxID=59729 RepID=A0A674GQX7_TAEGU